MNGRRRHPLRVLRHAGWFAIVVMMAFLDFLFRRLFQKSFSLPDRAKWLQRHSRRALKMFKLVPHIDGTVPAAGLLITNHLSYLDVLVISSVTPAVFVAKREVRSWPVLGVCARLAGTLFVNRERKMQVGDMNAEIAAALDAGVLVVLFPEGTSSDGRTVLPFKSALLEPAAAGKHPVTIGCVRYELDEGDVADEVCYWGDHVFFSHMLNLLGKATVRAALAFAPIEAAPVVDRKELARRMREDILRLKERR